VSLEELVHQACRLSTTESRFHGAVQPMEDLVLLRGHSPSTYEASLYNPVLCLILRGRKQVVIGSQTLSFGPGECLLVSHDLPVRSKITKAPYLALVFEVSVASVRELCGQVAAIPRDGDGGFAATTQRADHGLLDAFLRYLLLANTPADAKVLGPLVSKEIHYRLLVAPFGGMLRSLIRHDSEASSIGRAINHIRADLRSPIVIPDLARRVGMSPSSFHKHFKRATSTTPLQYHKELRLLEARRLLRAGTAVTAVAFDIGYESPSQFSREYARKFGVPPSRDMANAST
jgi:AraC-like DNA-binding protein